MNVLRCGVLLTVFCCVCCAVEEPAEAEGPREELNEGREAKQLRDPTEHGGWRAVQPSVWEDSHGWIPKSRPEFPDSSSGKPIVRRRRIRKRKRRPPVPVRESEDYLPRRRRKRPQTLEEINRTWGEVDDELVRRPYSRRRTTPVYISEIHTDQPFIAISNTKEDINKEKSSNPRDEIEKTSHIQERVRDPFTALEEAEAKARLRKKQQGTEPETTTVSYLKVLLKQTEGSLSLSELLQQKNLSLDDLLKGKQQAISVLTEKPYTSTEAMKSYKNITLEPSSTESSPKNTTTKMSEHSTSNIIHNYDDVEDSLETITTKRKSYNQRTQSTIHHRTHLNNYEVITEPTTERRIFVPSHPKHYSFYNYRPKINNKIVENTTKPTTKASNSENVRTTHATTSSTTQKRMVTNKYWNYRSKYVSLKPKPRSTLPITNAKINRLTSRKPNLAEEIGLPPQAFKINITDVFGIAEIAGKIKSPTTVKPDETGPMKMIIDLEKLIRKVTSTTEQNNSVNNYLNKLDSFENEITTEVDHYKKKIKPSSAREEIMEILKDHISRQNLSRILEMRNMSIEQLIEQRERGSSQLHLADIFHNQTREPEPPSEPFVGHVGSIPNSFFDRKPKTVSIPTSVKKDSAGADYFASVIDLKPLQSDYDRKENAIKKSIPAMPVYTVTSFPTYKIEMDKIMNYNEQAPFQLSIWKSLYPNLYSGVSENINQKPEVDTKPYQNEDILENDIHRLEDVENSISDSANEKLNIDLKEDNFEDKEFLPLPRGVKSAIIASAVIIAISVFVFLTVFFIFKMLQKQRKRFCYANTFTCSKIRSPILDTQPKRTIRTIMCETLGRKKKYSNAYPQSMSDYSWDSDKKPFQ